MVPVIFVDPLRAEPESSESLSPQKLANILVVYLDGILKESVDRLWNYTY
jgi:hypothetical protein